MVGPSGLLAAIIGYRSFAVSVLVWGWGKKKKLILVLRNIVFHCHILRAPVELLYKMILASTKGVFECQVIIQIFNEFTSLSKLRLIEI